MKPLATSDRPYSSSGSWNALRFPSKSEKWVCMPEPWTPASGLGMNVAWRPASSAISFTISRVVMTVSAMVRASVYRRSTSCWLGESSCWLYSTGIPMSSRVRTVRRRSSLPRSETVSSKYEPWSSGSGPFAGSPCAK